MLRVKERDKIPRYDAALDTRQSTEPVFRFVSTSGHVNGSEISFISPLVLQSRALTRYQRFEQNGSLTDLDTSIHCFEAAENIAVLNDRLRHISRHKHAVALLARFRKTKTVRDLNNATTRLKELSKIQPEGHPLRPLAVKTLNEALQLRSESARSMAFLDTAIRLDRHVLDTCLAHDPEKEICYSRLASSLVSRASMNNSVRDLDNAIGLYQRVLKIHYSGHPERLATLANVTKALRCRYALTKKQVDLDDASGYEREGQDLYWSEKGKPSSVQKPFIKSRIVTLTVQSLDRYSLTIQIDVTNSIGQLMEMILDKTGACEGVRGLFYKGRVLSSGWTIADCIPDPKYIIYLVYSRSATATQTNAIEDTRVLFFANPARIPQSQDAKGTLRIMDPHRTISVDADLVTPGVARENMDRSNSEETLQVKVVRLLEMGFSSKREAALALVAAAHDFETAIEFLLNGIPEGRKAAAELYVAIRGGLDSIMGETTMRIPSFGATRAGERPLIMSSWENMDGEGLDTKIGVWQTILGLVPPGYPGRSGVLNNLGVVVSNRFKQAGDRADLEMAIRLYEEALQLRSPGHPDRSSILNNLAIAIKSCFEQSGDHADLETAIRYFEEALQLQPPGHPDRSSSLSNLAAGLQHRIQQSGDRADLETAIRLHEEALQLLPLGHPGRSSSLSNLAAAILHRFTQSGDRADLETAIKYFEEALQLRPPGHPDRPCSLGNLASGLNSRFEHSGDRADLETAIRLHEEALKLHPPGHPLRSPSLINLAGTIMCRFHQSGDRADAETATRYFEEALRLLPPGHCHRSPSLSHLAVAISRRFQQSGDHADLETAIRLHEEALRLLLPGHPDRPSVLVNLGSAVVSRFQQSGDRTDLSMAIRYFEETLQLCPPGHRIRSAGLNNLATVIQYGFHQAGNPAHVEMAIRFNEEVLQLRPPGHPDRSCSLNNLAGSLNSRFYQSKDREDLEAAIKLYEEALQLLPPGHEDRPFSLINLAMAISYPFDQSRDHADLERAIRLHEEALKLLPPPHPDRSCSLGNLANVILTLFGRTRARSDLDRAMSLMEEACSSEHGNLEARFVVSWNWTRCSLQHAHPSVLKSFTAALELLDTLVTMSSSLDSRYRRTFGTMLVQPESLASDAAAVALYLDQPRRAVELLEQGRGILLAQLARYRTALDDLRAVCPEIATEFTELSSQLEESVSRRGTDGMHGMLGTSKPDLGPVVIVNISEIRSDAIILRNNATPEIVSLPGATHEEISRIASMMDHAVRAQDEGRPQGEVDEVLRLLWGCVVQPVVERLESLGVVRGSHIWWCPTSKLCSLPLHAAGIYRPKQPRLPDMFFSSYISTLSSLIRARSGPSGAIGRPSILAIGVPQPDGTDGADGALHFVDAELQKLLDRAPDVELVKGQDATHDAVSKQLPVHSWVHFSCHGHQDKTQPFNSRFRLQDKPLTLQEVVRMHLPNAELAFLSACHTAAGDWNTPDERLHLAAGMQFSGFRGVVGTLWAMDDIDGPDVAESFYGYMFRNGEEGANYKDAAKGVHEMSKALRRKKVPLDRWINFIHVGA
ncbi:hypothetical protein FRB96_007064 [Tulasnella sp. 330]|nr:hypothetical protein FRB96_007064 [Tulasnella sp. 330]